MNNLNMKQFALFLAGILSLTIFGTLVSVQAQTESKQNTPPKLIKVQDAANMKLQGNGKPFLPPNLSQSDKPNEGGTRTVIGNDDRVPMTSKKYPWSAIGRVQGINADGQGYHCTGTLIASDLVLTNAHCVIDPDTHKLSKEILFLPNLINGDVDKTDIAVVERVVVGTDFKDSSGDVNDWAVVKLNKPLGQKYGYLGWKSLPSSFFTENPEKVVFAGYSGDFPDPRKKPYQGFNAGPGMTAGVHFKCSILGEQEGILLHNCDTTGGSSGGAILASINGQPHIVALNNAEIRGKVNLAVKISFLDRLFGLD
ncbi:trypsin-like serine peptidase [Iningainema tapete]|uniref:Trypsin-like peptidase domain-containing protein n=1 Tax=Iningainema tapete BLCC-T55 TaxID=2748662 RepID=A0A8J7C7D6_9CYAN|nr:trypsin-like peptidase domain-containing protein [Iningainema tapete]MBD2773041.1 trypsin-like peptidase domain-containing protein [Iningainema tapete BLCC-T55]